MASIGRGTGTEEFRNWHFEEGPDVIQVRFLTKAFKMDIIGYFQRETAGSQLLQKQRSNECNKVKKIKKIAYIQSHHLHLQ